MCVWPARASRSPAVNYREPAPPIWRRFLWESGRYVQGGIHKLPDAPSFIRQTDGLRWRRLEGFMHTAEIIVRNVKRKHPTCFSGSA
jgi:hypothetical protein